MTTTTKTRPDVLRITTTGVLGHNSGVKVIAGGRLTVTKGFNEPTDSIEIETVDGTFKRAPRETALVNITFADGEVWSGDFRALQAAINSGKQALDLISKIEDVLIEQLDEDYKQNASIIQIQQQSQDLLNEYGRPSALNSI